MQPSKVLVVDDSDLMHTMYSVFLRGVKLVHARDGAEALEVLERDSAFDLMLLDINMPRMDGFELLGQLEAKGHLPGLPVIVVTTEGKEADAARGLAKGATAYLTKPFRADQVRAAIAALPDPAR